VVFRGKGEVVWFLAENERSCGLFRRGRGGVVFSGEGEIVCCLAERESCCGV